ncbi:MAG: ABC transporter permease [Cyclobacteriaceae bacterium]|nr:ABC transporter permease [Cyclobacteriaceae bacterium]
MSDRLLANFYIAMDAVLANKIRSLLTGLGIIFGVAAVIAMLAIGNGAQQEILEQIKLVGVNNIVIKPIVEQKDERIEEQVGKKEKKKFSPGLTLRDVNSIRELVPEDSHFSPEIMIETNMIRQGYRRSAKLVGVLPEYFNIFNFSLQAGQMFNDEQLRSGSPVCIIGHGIRSRFFPTEEPVGKSIKVGPHWLKIVGVLEERAVSASSISKLGIRDFNMDVYTPLQTILIRYRNRDLITAEALRKAAMKGRGMVIISGNNNNQENTEEAKNYHQLDRLVVQVAETRTLKPVADVMQRMLKRRHYDVVDYEIEIPELLLKQQQRTNDIFNYVLGAIAGISLLVGGIGIMNIMLASVLERIKEIGLRLAIGAQKKDIVQQFLFEAIFLSLIGGGAGILLVFLLTFLPFGSLEVVLSVKNIVLGLGVSSGIGLIAGIVPAAVAARLDPVIAIRAN